MSLILFMDEGFEEAEAKKSERKQVEKEEHKCACGRAVCCGKHKGNHQCSCRNNQKERS